jgi:hypothetical protein
MGFEFGVVELTDVKVDLGVGDYFGNHRIVKIIILLINCHYIYTVDC